MKLVDANVLLYAVNEDEPHHTEAKNWLDTSLVRTESIGFAWSIVLAFLRVSTRSPAFARPFDTEHAVARLEKWLAQPPAVVVEPTRRHLPLVAGLLRSVGTAGNLVNDAHLAALALEHDATVISYDSDFGRFEGVRWASPGD
ncbi:MAG: type II toxin-antitoxin system VapC family toxin [Thermoleophilaceae bacterium]|nr:type II toxin-antitoxin system VapC family toxin [Thermoleophilaceae bacterium]